MHVLVVDDNELIQQVIGRFLVIQGHTVATLASAAEALAYAGEQTPDLVIVDIHLPDRDGGDLVAELRALPGRAQLPAVAISGLSERQLPKGALTGFNDYLAKPIDLDELTALIERYNSTVIRQVGEQ